MKNKDKNLQVLNPQDMKKPYGRYAFENYENVSYSSFERNKPWEKVNIKTE